MLKGRQHAFDLTKQLIRLVMTQENAEAELGPLMDAAAAQLVTMDGAERSVYF